MPVRRLLQEVDSAEITEWMAFETLEPFGPLADQYRAGVTAAAAFNSQRCKESDRYFMPHEFVAELAAEHQRRKPPARELSPGELSDLIDAELFGVANGG